MRRQFFRPSLPILLGCLALSAAGCTGEPSGSSPDPREGAAATVPFAGCADLTAPLAATPVGSPTPPASSGGEDASPPSRDASPARGDARTAGGDRLPSVRLPCFAGGEPVDVGALRGPAVVNLWASWCGPCRKELPALQRLSERADGTLRVIGVDTRDRRESAAELAVDLGVTFPHFFDLDQKLLAALERPVVPVTIFVDGEGRIRHLDDSGALDDATLDRLVEQHLGLAVAP